MAVRELEVQARIQAPREDVFAVLGDPCRPHLTALHPLDVALCGLRKGGPGTVYRWQLWIPALRHVFVDEEVVAWEAPSLLASRARARWTLEVETRLAEDGDGTRVALRVRYGFGGLLAWVPRGALRALARRALRSLEAKVHERLARATGPAPAAVAGLSARVA